MKTLYGTIQEALAFAKTVNIDEYEPGVYPVNDDFFMVIQKYMSKTLEQAPYEAHKRHIDIHYIVEGKEAFGVATLDGMKMIGEYDEDKDLYFLEDPEKEAVSVLVPGGYAIVGPEYAHRPGLMAEESVFVKKVLIKVIVK